VAADPTVSVVIIVGRRRERGAGSLASILGQDGIERCEVLLVDAAPDGTPPLRGFDHPSVRVLPMPFRPRGGTIRTTAIRRARAPVVAFLEEHSRALPGYLVGIEEVFADGSVAAASGEIGNLNPGLGFTDAAHVMSFWRWSPPLERGWDADMVNSHNAVYRRAEIIGLDDLDALMESEIVLHWALKRQGRVLRIDPRLRITHLSEGTTRAIIKGYYLWHVSFGRTWASVDGWSAARRAMQVVGVPWWVFLRVKRMLAEVPPASRRVLIRNLPGVIAAQSAAAVGLAVGCLGQDASAAARFTDYELDVDRPAQQS
jgi:hypothetical protein